MHIITVYGGEVRCMHNACCLFPRYMVASLYAACAVCRYVANADRLGAVVMEHHRRADSLDDEDDECRDCMYS